MPYDIEKITVTPTITDEHIESYFSLATNDMTTSQSKHVDIKYHYIRDLVKQDAISIIWCPISDMLADILTKFSLPSSVLLKHACRMLSGTYPGPDPV